MVFSNGGLPNTFGKEFTMTGSLQIKNEKYYVVLNSHENGKRKQKWISTGLPVKNNKRKAEQMLRDILLEHEKKNPCTQSDVLFSDYVRMWLKQSKKTVGTVTYMGYKSIANLHVLPYFDKNKLLLQDVTVSDLQFYFDEKTENGRIDENGGLSPRSIRMHKNVINQTLKLAIKNGLIQINPCESVKLPKNEHYEATFYTAQQMQTLFKAVEGDVLHDLIKITAIYGLRRSEVLGIKKDSIDWDNGLLTIKYTVKQVGKEIIEEDKTKNASSLRSFPLTDEAKEIFETALENEKINKKLFGKKYMFNDYLFKWDNGEIFQPNYVTKRFSKLLEKNGLPHIRFHEIRHSCASLLMNEGFTLKDIQEWMGHADITTTANIYGHLDISRKVNMAERLSNALS